METRDKILILIVIACIAAAIYYKVSMDKMFARMDEMEFLQLKHVDEVNSEFREDLRDLNLKFIGRGKHLKKAKQDIVANTQLINDVADSLSRDIETVQLNLEDHERFAEARFKKVEENAEQFESQFKSFKRRSHRDIADLDERLRTAEDDIEDINAQMPKKK